MSHHQSTCWGCKWFGFRQLLWTASGGGRGASLLTWGVSGVLCAHSPPLGTPPQCSELLLPERALQSSLPRQGLGEAERASGWSWRVVRPLTEIDLLT